MDTIMKQRRSLTPLPRPPESCPPESWDGFAGMREDVFNWLLETLLIWQERAAQRWALQQLDDHLLKDIGVSRADALREASKPFWRP